MRVGGDVACLLSDVACVMFFFSNGPTTSPLHIAPAIVKPATDSRTDSYPQCVYLSPPPPVLPVLPLF